MPLPEHPRPVFQRAHWVNLNGPWAFALDPENIGERQGWSRGKTEFDQKIVVPYSWAAPLSGVKGNADVAWYQREIDIPLEWAGERVFFVVGASDWRTTVWLDGQQLGSHEGGYTPFEFELTSQVKPGGRYALVLRVDDAARPHKLEGKQGYGQARGMWQTPYLEARGGLAIGRLAFTPDVQNQRVALKAHLLDAARVSAEISLTCGSLKTSAVVDKGVRELSLSLPIPNPRLWSLEDPHLYECEVVLAGHDGKPDRVSTYFGMRTVGVVDLPGHGHPYVALNGRPVYLQMALDQAFHPTGFYTFPSDEFVREEVLRARRLGLNTLRVHVKVPLPRKLYWADRLGVLVMADVPNGWGEPDAALQKEHGHTWQQMLQRDFNHPSIFAWVLFNETWGLTHGTGNAKTYTPQTQAWVQSVYQKAKQLDPTRLIEDNSPNLGDHVATDINSWHNYLAGSAWNAHVADVVKQSFPGSNWNFVQGKQQGRQPLVNSEFGNVWGYDGNTGDVDFSWDYHEAINAFRRHPKVAGWLYTEHHDVINEWNGYFRFDRSEKYPGLSDLAPGMALSDFHSPMFVVVGEKLCETRKPNERVNVPVWTSFYDANAAWGKQLRLRTRLHGWDALGQPKQWDEQVRSFKTGPWHFEALAPLAVRMPSEPAVVVLSVRLETEAGVAISHNFTTFVVKADASAKARLASGQTLAISRVSVAAVQQAQFSGGHSFVLQDKKLNGLGNGFVKYNLAWPSALKPNDKIDSAVFLAEVSTRPQLGKDSGQTDANLGSYMRGAGAHDPSLNSNSYPMTDTHLNPGAVNVWVNDVLAGRYDLPDDPADHRGILSWHAQAGNKRLAEAGTYGYRLQVPIPPQALDKARSQGAFEVRLEVADGLGTGLAVYGAEFGRYPLDPTVVLTGATAR